MENINENHGTKRKREEMVKERKKYPSDTKEARKQRNLKSKQAQNQHRGTLVYYYKNDEEKIELFNKIDKIKLFLGEGAFNKVSTFSLLHRLCDFFINVNIPGGENVRQEVVGENNIPCMYQHVTVDEASKEEMFIGCISSLHKLVSQVETHAFGCPQKLKVTEHKKLQQVASLQLKCDSSDHTVSWTSSPHLDNGKFLANMKICHGYFTSGMLPNQYTKFCEDSGLGVTGDRYLADLSSSYAEVVEAAVKKSYKQALLEEIALTSAQKEDDLFQLQCY